MSFKIVCLFIALAIISVSAVPVVENVKPVGPKPIGPQPIDQEPGDLKTSESVAYGYGYPSYYGGYAGYYPYSYYNYGWHSYPYYYRGYGGLYGSYWI